MFITWDDSKGLPLHNIFLLKVYNYTPKINKFVSISYIIFRKSNQNKQIEQKRKSRRVLSILLWILGQIIFLTRDEKSFIRYTDEAIIMRSSYY